MEILQIIFGIISSLLSLLLSLGLWVINNPVTAIATLLALGLIFFALRFVFDLLKAAIALFVIIIALAFLYQYTPLGEWLGRESAPDIQQFTVPAGIEV